MSLHPTLFNTPLIYSASGKDHLAQIYLEYRTIALQHGLPIILCAPTWRCDKAKVQEAGVSSTVNRDAVTFMRDLCNGLVPTGSSLYIGGLLAPKNDCYDFTAALSRQESRSFHHWQIQELAFSGVDVIICQTLPSKEEACGMADVLSQHPIPYIISFVITKDGVIYDNTPILEAIKYIDRAVSRPPFGYMVNCVYPTYLNKVNKSASAFKRILGIQANASSKDPRELDNSSTLQKDSLSDWGDRMISLNKQHGIKILGGCCGTDDTYLKYLTDNIFN